jgi:DNA-binding PadR family transcriptional regulator
MRDHMTDSGVPRVHGSARRHERHAKHHDRIAQHHERVAHRHGRGERGWGGGPRGFGGPGDRGHRGGHRAGRGDVRAAVLALLNEEPMHGYQIIQELSERSEGAWTPSPGSIYPALQLLQDEGLVTASESDGKRVFTLTEAGKTEAAARGEGPLPWESAARGERSGMSQLRELMGQVFAATRQVASAGTEAQVAKAAELLTSTRRELYRILAEDDTTTTE